MAGYVHAHSKDTTLMWFARLAVGRAGNVQIAQVRPAEGHHSWVLDRKFDDPIQSSVRRVSVKAPAAMYCAPVEPLLVERAAVWNSKVFRYFGKDPFSPKFTAFHIEFTCIDSTFARVRQKELAPVSVPSKAVVEQARVIVRD